MRAPPAAAVLAATAVLLALAAAPAHAGMGIDISSAYTPSDLSCFHRESIDFIIVRAWHSYSGPDTNAPPTLKAASKAGFETHAYMFPCPAKNVTDQVKATLDFLHKNDAPFSTLWFDIETDPSPGCGWSSDKEANCHVMRRLADAAPAGAGVYISTYMHESILGDSCTAGHNLKLWYAHYDNSKSFSDFSPFGGWTSPHMKQYDDGQKSPLCGHVIDRDWRA